VIDEKVVNALRERGLALGLVTDELQHQAESAHPSTGPVDNHRGTGYAPGAFVGQPLRWLRNCARIPMSAGAKPPF